MIVSATHTSERVMFSVDEHVAARRLGFGSEESCLILPRQFNLLDLRVRSNDLFKR